MEEHSSFYPDEVRQLKMENQTVFNLKRKMTLDFDASAGKTKQQKVTSLLLSPDMNLLKLASPELEKMIIAANGQVTTTPTPTQFIFPKYVTDEQEAYARGFVEALNNLHQTKPEDSDSDEDSVGSVGFPTSSAPNMSLHHSVMALTTTTSLPGGLVNTSSIASNKLDNLSRPSTISQLGSHGLNSIRFKEEPQTVPNMSDVNSPPLSPINMESQERIKLERKRARNRVAARKCRTRKLERISRLEDKVDDLKGQNGDLASTASTLRNQVSKLKQQIIEHVNSGCNIMMSSSLSF